MGEIWTGPGKENRLRRIIDNDYLTLLVRLTVGITFIYASFYKVVEPALFAKSIWYYHMLPGSLINLVALILPWVELLAGLALIFGVCYRGSVFLANIMTIVFIFALIVSIARGISIDCGCFKAGKTATRDAWNALFFDIGLLALTVYLFLSRSLRWQFKSK